MEIEFEEFRLDTSRSMLWHDQTFIPLGARACAILTSLLEAPGTLVTKAELFERAWPDVSVDAANLRVQIANLRRTLGNVGANIVTEQSLGYRYAGAVRRLTGAGARILPKRFCAPGRLQSAIGREGATASVCAALVQHRLVTIVGAGGIGKTTLALEVANEIESEFTDGVCFADLSIASGPAVVATTIAAALERPVMGDPHSDVLTYLRSRRVLIVLDCCERVVEACAEFADALLAAAPGVSIIATSRESMRLTGEFVESLGGLETPSEGPIDARRALEFAAVALFSRTAKASSAWFELNDANASAVTRICQRLDGVPLAIDLAAGLTGVLTLEEIEEGLSARMAVQTFGRRGGLSRHRTLDAAIAWSYDTLEDDEATVLRRLSVFADFFPLHGALDVVAYGKVDRSSAELAVISLARKSLLSVAFRDGLPQYRLSETTRLFASNRLRSDGDRETAAAHHAQYVLRWLPRIEWEQPSFMSDRRAALGASANVRDALDWAYLSADPLLPVRLTVAAERLWLELGLYAEHSARMKTAHAWLERSGAAVGDYPDLLAAVLSGIAYGVIYEPSDDERINIVLEAQRRAQDVGDTELYMRNLSHAYFYHALRHQGHQALNIAERIRDVARASGQHEVAAFATVAAANSRIQIGDLRQARTYLERYLSSDPCTVSRRTIIYFGFNTSALALFSLGIIEGAEGYTTRSFDYLDRAIAVTDDGRQPQMRFQVLYFAACRMAFRCGDLSRARVYLDLLEQQARDFAPWKFMTRAYHAWMAFAQGHTAKAREMLESDTTKNPLAALVGSFNLLLADVRLALGDLDGADEAAALIWKMKTGEHDLFAAGPTLRARADIAFARATPESMQAAADLYERAIENARRHDAVTFEIPAALGLARLEFERGRAEIAKGLLRGVLERAPDGHNLPPLRQAAGYLAEIEGSIAVDPAELGRYPINGQGGMRSEQVVEEKVKAESPVVEFANAVGRDEAVLQRSAKLAKAVPGDRDVLVAVGHAGAPDVDEAHLAAIAHENVIQGKIAVRDHWVGLKGL